jgi:hypothetical protein
MHRTQTYITILNALFGVNINIFLYNVSRTFFQEKHWFITTILLKESCAIDTKFTLFIKKKQELENHYIKIRHAFFLPVRGQRTHTNAKTRKKKNQMRKKIGFIKKNG